MNDCGKPDGLMSAWRLVGGVLMAFAIPYAIWVALRDERPRNTWKLVVLGDAVCDLATAAVIYKWTKNPLLACVSIIHHFMAGTPMITGQILKHYFYDQHTNALLNGEDDVTAQKLAKYS